MKRKYINNTLLNHSRNTKRWEEFVIKYPEIKLRQQKQRKAKWTQWVKNKTEEESRPKMNLNFDVTICLNVVRSSLFIFLTKKVWTDEHEIFDNNENSLVSGVHEILHNLKRQ